MFKVFTRPNCQYCVRTKDLLKKLNEPYEEYKVGETFTVSQMFEMIGKQVRSMPQIMKDDKLIGGYTDLREYFINEGKINFSGQTKE